MSAIHFWFGAFVGLISMCVTARAQPTAPVFFGAAQGRVLMGVVAAPDGTAYLTFKGGGRHDLGTLARRTPSGQLSVLHEFDGFHGGRPDVPLRFGPDGALYGTTSLGGELGNGTAFRITTEGELTTLYNFTRQDGGPPKGPLLVEADGGILGVTAGTFYFNCIAGDWRCTSQARSTGKVFELRADGAFSVLYKGIPEAGGGLTRASTGGLCGVTRWIDPNRWGAPGSVYCLSPDGAISFGHLPNNPSFDPRGELVEANGYLYGLTPGIVFRFWLGFEPDASDFEEFPFVASSDYGPTFGSDGNLYFTGYNLDLMRMSPLGLRTRIATYEERLGLPTTTLNPDADGGFLLGFREYLLQATLTGGLSVLQHFGFADGYGLDALFLSKSGELYGTTMFGGQNGDGTLFRADAAGKLSALHHFDELERFPIRLRAPFVETPDGAVCALTGGFKPALVCADTTQPEPILETLHTFPSFDQNFGPSFGEDFLFAGEDGALYGSIEVEAGLRRLYRFDRATKELRMLAGARDFHQLLRTSTGDFYVTRWSSVGAQLCHWQPDGSLRALHTFRSDAYGHYPLSNLTEGPDGGIYGYAPGLGSSFDVVYRWTPTNGMEIYYNFPRSIATLQSPVKVVVAASGVVYVSTVSRVWGETLQTAQNFAISPNKTLKSLPVSASTHVIGRDGTVYRSEPLTRGSYHGFQLLPL